VVLVLLLPPPWRPHHHRQQQASHCPTSGDTPERQRCWLERALDWRSGAGASQSCRQCLWEVAAAALCIRR
jgi:hypothetical protein